MSRSTYAPGDAHAIVTPHAVILVDHPGAATLARLWEGAAVADVMAILDALGVDGFASMPEFAAVVHGDDDLRVVTRGAGTVKVVRDGESFTCDATGVSTWSEQRLSGVGVTSIRLSIGGAPNGDDELPIVHGVVRAASVTVGERAETATAVEPEPEPVPVVEPEREPDVEPEREPDVEPEREPDVEPEPEPEVEGLSPRREDPDPGETIVEPDEASFDALFGATVGGRRPEDAAVRQPEEDLGSENPSTGPVPPAPDGPAGDHDSQTMTPEQFAQLRAAHRRPLLVSPPPAAPETPMPRATLSLSTGREVIVDRPVLVGRSPQARNASSAQLPTLVVVDDFYVSGTHLEISFVGTELHATDTSTNGTLLQRSAGLLPEPMVKSVATVISDGAVLHISDTLSISVSIRGADR